MTERKYSKNMFLLSGNRKKEFLKKGSDNYQASTKNSCSPLLEIIN